MRCLRKNQRQLHYKNYSSMTQIVDENGLYTGEYTPIYSDLISANMSVSFSGYSIQQEFGIEGNYSAVLVTDDMNCSMDENSIVWIHAPITEDHDFIVKRKIESLNHIVYGLAEVNVNGQYPSPSQQEQSNQSD